MLSWKLISYVTCSN